MKYLKNFENNKNIQFHKNDLIVDESTTNVDVYLVMNDSYETDNRVLAFFIGYIDKTKKQFNTKINYTIYGFSVRNRGLRKVNEKEKNLICDVLYLTDDVYSNGIKTNMNIYLDFVKSNTNIDLKELPELKNFEVSRNANKFNI